MLKGLTGDIKLRNPKVIVLVILPLFVLLFSGIFQPDRMPWYMGCPDPIYSYFFNGLSIAGGNLKVDYIDHPGIPVQYFTAAIIYFKHFFNHSIPLYHDVLLHPEEYLNAICISITVVYFLISLFTGYYLFKRTGNLKLSLLFQLTPFIGREYISASAPTPEDFILMGGMFFIAYLFCNSIYANAQSPDKISFKKILIYGAFSAFLISCKYTCLPILILVLFLLPSTRTRIQYWGSFLIFFIIFYAPVIPEWQKIYHWLLSIATHTGKYGGGESGVAQPSVFLSNLESTFKQDVYFTAVCILMCVSLLIVLFNRKKHQISIFDSLAKRKQILLENTIYLRLLSGILFLALLLILVVAKQYSFHYLIALKLCFPLILVASYGVFRDLAKIKLFQNKLISGILFYILAVYFVSYNIHNFIEYPVPKAYYETSDFLNKYPNTPIIITADLGSSRIEGALDLGVAYTSRIRDVCKGFLKQIYPYSYVLKRSPGIITHWDDIFYTPELFSEYPDIIVYFNDKDSNARTSILTYFCMWGKDTMANCKLVYTRKESNEYVYELKGNRGMAKILMSNPTEVNFDLEKLSPDKSSFISSDGKHLLDGVDFLSTKVHRSGNNSILMHVRDKCIFNYPIKAFPGNMVNLSIWQKSDNGTGFISLVSSSGAQLSILGSAVIDSDSNGWKKIESKCIVPSSVNDSTVIFHLYYFGEGNDYCDDIKVKVYPMSFNNYTFIPQN